MSPPPMHTRRSSEGDSIEHIEKSSAVQLSRAQAGFPSSTSDHELIAPQLASTESASTHTRAALGAHQPSYPSFVVNAGFQSFGTELAQGPRSIGHPITVASHNHNITSPLRAGSSAIASSAAHIVRRASLDSMLAHAGSYVPASEQARSYTSASEFDSESSINNFLSTPHHTPATPTIHTTDPLILHTGSQFSFVSQDNDQDAAPQEGESVSLQRWAYETSNAELSLAERFEKLRWEE